MEPWLIYALLSTITTGLFSFFQKVSVEKNHNPALVTFYSLSVAGFLSLLYLIFLNNDLGNIYLGLSLGFINGFLYFITTITRIKSLKYIDTSIYFPIYKGIAPIFIVLIGMYYFGEILSFKELIGVGLGIIVPIILIGRNKKSNNTSSGIKLLFYGLIASTIAASTIKIGTQGGVNIVVYMLTSLFTGSILGYTLHKIKKETSSYSIIKIKRIGLLTGIFQFMGFFFLLKAIEIGDNLGVSFTMQSLYIVIPIVLSIIFYKEHFDKKKLLAVILSILSILFLA